MLMPTVKRYMSRQPWTITPSAKMSEAHRVMREHHIRHLPVLDQGKLVGIVSERDLHLIETLPGSDPEDVTVDEAMIADVYAVSPDEEVDKVIEKMADNKLGSALVVTRNGKVEGIFTTIDALQCFADVLRRAMA
ncbi:MAG TPA: CBS domain-containing protein [Kofleriaceae bacterium]|nr:CBS domain-containing protein [Kofleriaceae bacterium]